MQWAEMHIGVRDSKSYISIGFNCQAAENMSLPPVIHEMRDFEAPHVLGAGCLHNTSISNKSD